MKILGEPRLSLGLVIPYGFDDQSEAWSPTRANGNGSSPLLVGSGHGYGYGRKSGDGTGGGFPNLQKLNPVEQEEEWVPSCDGDGYGDGPEGVGGGGWCVWPATPAGFGEGT